MKFVLVFITAQMAQGGANLGPLPGAPEFDTQQPASAFGYHREVRAKLYP